MTMILWNLDTGDSLLRMTGHTGSVLACDFSPAGRRLLVSGSDDFTLRFWNAQTGKVIRSLTGHKDAIFAVKFR